MFQDRLALNKPSQFLLLIHKSFITLTKPKLLCLLLFWVDFQAISHIFNISKEINAILVQEKRKSLRKNHWVLYYLCRAEIQFWSRCCIFHLLIRHYFRLACLRIDSLIIQELAKSVEQTELVISAWCYIITYFLSFIFRIYFKKFFSSAVKLQSRYSILQITSTLASYFV